MEAFVKLSVTPLSSSQNFKMETIHVATHAIIPKASKNATFHIWSYPKLTPVYRVYQTILISRQHFSEADSIVQTGQAAFVDKGAQFERRYKKGKTRPFIQDAEFALTFMTCSFALKILGLLNIAPNSVHTWRQPAFI